MQRRDFLAGAGVAAVLPLCAVPIVPVFAVAPSTLDEPCAESLGTSEARMPSTS